MRHRKIEGTRVGGKRICYSDIAYFYKNSSNMKNLFLAIVAIAFAAVNVTAQNQHGKHQISQLQVGATMPGNGIKMKNATGKDMTLKEAVGQNGTLVMFSCNTCPFVIRNQPVTTKAVAYAKEHNIGVVILNANEGQRSDDDSYEAMKKYAQENGYTVPYLIDQNSRLADMFGAGHTPEVFLFDKNNKLVYKGAMNDNPGDPSGATKLYVQAAIDNLLAGKPIDPTDTKSVGCSIKRI
jgi:peroxiredoxin